MTKFNTILESAGVNPGQTKWSVTKLKGLNLPCTNSG